MFSYKKSLPAPHAFESQAMDPEPFGGVGVAAGVSRRSGPGAGRSTYSQDITVLLLNDTPLMRECLSMSLNHCDRGLHVVTAASVADVEATLRGEPGSDGANADVVLCHLGGAAPDPGSTALVRRLLGILGGTPLIVLSDCEEPATILETFRLGVRGYIPTSVGLSMALEAIRLVGAGGTFLPANFLQRLVLAPVMQAPVAPAPHPAAVAEAPPEDRPSGKTPQIEAPQPGAQPDEREEERPDHYVDGLTPRQLAVLKCLREGKANKVIAYELDMCESTVKVHVRNILKRLGATNRTQAVYLTFNRSPA